MHDFTSGNLRLQARKFELNMNGSPDTHSNGRERAREDGKGDDRGGLLKPGEYNAKMLAARPRRHNIAVNGQHAKAILPESRSVKKQIAVIRYE
jgi:hypothetical protein